MHQFQNTLDQAIQLHRAGRVEEAINLYEKLLSRKKNNPDVLYLLGTAYYQTGQYEHAAKLLNRSIAYNKNNALAYCNRGMALNALKRYDEALASYDRALGINPNYAEAYCYRGIVLNDLGRFNAALHSYNQALRINPNYAQAYCNRGVALNELKRLDEALASYDQALGINPNYAQAHCNRGNVLKYLKRLNEALAGYDQALLLNSNYAEAYSNRGVVLNTLMRYEEALTSLDQALRINRNYAQAYNNRGNVLKDLHRPDEALASYDQALRVDPHYADAYCNRGNVLKELNRLDEALVSYDLALANNPEYEFLPGLKLHIKMYLCDWNNHDAELEALIQKVGQRKKATLPFSMLALMDSLNINSTVAEIWARNNFPGSNDRMEPHDRPDHAKIRVGYYSADFHNHATMHLLAEIFENHNKAQIELYAFSFGPLTNDPWQQRAVSAFDRFIDCRHKTDEEIVKLSRGMGIDIAVDLKGYTNDARTGIFASRAAPIQVNFLGYPGTMSAGYIDYLIADKVLIPEQSRRWYSEKIAYLPHCYQPNCRAREISDKSLARFDFGLPDQGVVLSSFNNTYKITPSLFASWMRILKAVDGSVLWLLATNPTAQSNLRTEAIKNGVDEKRLIFANLLPGEEHLNRLRLADLMLDTFPYGAHTTCSDALRMGLPVIALMGETFASRVAASLLTAAGLPALISHSRTEYENLAIKLANNPDELAQIRCKLAENFASSPLFDSALFTQNIEQVFRSMYERFCQNKPLDDIQLN